MLQGYAVSQLWIMCTPDIGLTQYRFLDTDERGIHLHTTVETRSIQAVACPIGISPSDFDFTFPKQKAQFDMQLQKLEDEFKDYRLIIGVDRIDYTKGLTEKLKAFDHFLSTRPEYKSKVVLLQIGVPSRESLSEIKNLLEKIYSLVGEINSRHGKQQHHPFHSQKQSPNKIPTTGSIHYTPIRFLHQSIDKVQLAALYSASDMCLVTAIRDGMNLVSYEYVACQQKRNGVLLLGKRIGAANTLKGAVLIEPLDAEDVAENIQLALEMPAGERRSRQETSIKTVMTQTSAWWGNEFVRKLREV